MTKLSATVLFILSLSAATVLAAESQVFKNSDLKKYSGGNDTQAVEQPRSSDTSSRQRKAAENGNVSDRKYWCNAATQAENRVKIAEENLSIANLRRGEAWRNLGSGIRSAAVETDAKSQRDLESAERELAEAKQEKEQLENEAHQKNVPPGWLRCQFE